MSSDEPDMTAAELALGLLDGAERAAAQRRVLAEPAFAAEVDRWGSRFAAIFAWAPEVSPPAALLDRIEASLSAEPASPAPVERRWLWPSIAAITSLAAAILLAIVLNMPPSFAPPAPAPAAAQLAAAVIVAEDEKALTAIYSPSAGELRLSAASLTDARHVAELWVIGRDGVPHSLGLLRHGHLTHLLVSQESRSRLTPTAILAVSVEPLGGSPTGKPTGPVIGKGTLALT